MVKYLEKEDFYSEIANGLWVVDFYADWCGPCKMLGPILEELDNNILKVNVDTHEELAQRYGIMSIPTICFFLDGELKNKVVGFRNKDELKEIIRGIN